MTGTTEEVEERKRKGKPRKSFTLLVNCLVAKGPASLDLGDVLHKYGQELAKTLNVANYYQIDSFKRRDALAEVVETILNTEFSASSMVTARTDTPDMKAFVEAVKPWAGVVLYGVGG